MTASEKKTKKKRAAQGSRDKGPKKSAEPKRAPEPDPADVAGPLASRARMLSAVGVMAAAVLAVSVNILVTRFYKRWDWTSQRLYTLSAATTQTLHGLRERIDVVVFLSQSDPLTLTVRHMLDAYGAETRQLAPRYVDPDRDPAEFLALQQEYGIRVEGKTEDGRLVTDAAIVVARGSKRWFLTTDDFFAYDDEGRAKSKLEQALTSAIRNVLSPEKVVICFSTGHGEISSDDGGPNGLAELRFRLQKNNFEPRVVDLVAEAKEKPLDECRLVVIAGPEEKFAPAEVGRVVRYFKRGGNVLVMVNPLLDEDSRITSSGLEPLTRAAGIDFGQDFVIEGDGAARLPSGAGETYFAKPIEHDITKGLVDLDEIKVRVVVSSAQSLAPREGKVRPASLLATTGEAFSVTDIRPFVNEGREVRRGEGDRKGPFSLAMASELPKAKDDDAHGPRMVVVGSANVAWGRNWRDAGLIGARLFTESAVAWLAARPAIIDVPEKAAQEAGVRLTEDSMNEVRRYVLYYMPGAAAVLGVLIMYRRRYTERESRRQRTDEGKKKTKKKRGGKR